MKLTCPKCWGMEFYASQVVSGTITVVVNQNGDFLRNTNEDGNIDPSGLNYDNPEGPFECVVCGTVVGGPED